MLNESSLPTVQRALVAAGLDGWLLFDFRGINPVASSMMGLSGMVTRRVFAWIPREGAPVAITHAIEQGPWHAWPESWQRVVYSSWRTLESHLASLVNGRRIAMEYSPGDAVPYLDRIPAGVLEMVRAAGATVESSGELVSRFYAVWTAAQRESHDRAAEIVASVGREAIARAGAAARGGAPLTEHQLQQWILDQFAAHRLETHEPPIVAVDANAANPHYEVLPEGSATIADGCVLLVDLWAREPDGVYADQTWMGHLGEPTPRALEVWRAIRDARDAAIAIIRDRLRAKKRVSGGEADDASRAVIEGRGFGKYFVHRTGHSIDSRDLHGSGPHLDNLETREERQLIDGVGFSIEPGIYITGEIGMRCEVNGFVHDGELLVTPREPQVDLIVV